MVQSHKEKHVRGEPILKSIRLFVTGEWIPAQHHVYLGLACASPPMRSQSMSLLIQGSSVNVIFDVEANTSELRVCNFVASDFNLVLSAHTGLELVETFTRRDLNGQVV